MVMFQITMQFPVVFLAVLAASWMQGGDALSCSRRIIGDIKEYNKAMTPSNITLTVSECLLKAKLCSRIGLMKWSSWNRLGFVGTHWFKFPWTSFMMTVILYCGRINWYNYTHGCLIKAIYTHISYIFYCMLSRISLGNKKGYRGLNIITCLYSYLSRLPRLWTILCRENCILS